MPGDEGAGAGDEPQQLEAPAVVEPAEPLPVQPRLPAQEPPDPVTASLPESAAGPEHAGVSAESKTDSPEQGALTVETAAIPPPDDPPVAAVEQHISSPKPQAGGSYRIRLADFVALPAARELFDAAVAAGHAGRLLHRVLLGPFASSGAAHESIGGDVKGFVVEDHGGWWVQVGVFAEAANAERLRAKLSASGSSAVVQARPELGLYSSRVEADQVLAALRELLGLNLNDANVIAVR